MQALAFLNLGASEIILILVVLLVLFGADKAPQLARSLGRARARLDQTRAQFTEALRTEDEKTWDEQLAFERERERKIAEAHAPEADAHAGPEEPPASDHAALVRSAEALGLQTQGLSDGELKAAIRTKLDAGPEKSMKNAADAQQ